MSDIAKDIAEYLLVSLKSGRISKIDIDEVRSTIVRYNVTAIAIGEHPLTQYEMEGMETRILQKVIEGTM